MSIASRPRWTLGAGHTCALLDDGSVKCWGGNQDGRLGLGDLESRGDDEGEMGEALPGVDLGRDRKAQAITAGSFHTCALLDDGSVKCWGLNGSGQLGIGDTVTRGDDMADMGDDLPPVELGDDGVVVALSAGFYHTCALFSTRIVKCWGDNSSGQLGLGNQDPRGLDLALMGDNLPAIDFAGQPVKLLAAGGSHACVLLADGSLKCWGGGGLGLGDASARGDGIGEMGANLPPVLLSGPGP